MEGVIDINKEMRIAQIVPKSSLELTANNQYHMCLAHLVLEDSEYATFYRRMSAENRFVIMDNGVAENNQLQLEALIESYRIVRPTEIVLPDTICNSLNTIEKSIYAYDYLKKNGILNELNTQIMVVPQGHSVQEWFECAKILLESIKTNTIGISKFLEMETGDSFARLKAIELLKQWQQNTHKEIEFHLLGCSEGPTIIKKGRSIASSLLRGCDSAFAYICTKNGILIDEYTVRPNGNINFLEDPFIEQLSTNMKRFELVCGVNNNYLVDGWNNK